MNIHQALREVEIVEELILHPDREVQYVCANCNGHIFICDFKQFLDEHDDWDGLILWSHVYDTGCDDPEIAVA